MAEIHKKMNSDIHTMSRLEIYKNIKHDFNPEPYIKIIRNRKHRGMMARARMGVLPIQVEIGRYRGTKREDRLCQNCNQASVEDVAHLLLKCPTYEEKSLNFFT